jgi:peptidoglycan/xylan/chitin deacetylase (PgdA/CDA1 family)
VGGPLSLKRDFRGYGQDPPQTPWPDGARLALNFVINYEEGAERNALDGYSERELLGEYFYDVPPGEREPFEESTYEFGSRVGVWRLLRLFDDAGIAPTIFGCAVALERNPEAVDAFRSRNCDLVGHGYRWESHRGLDVGEERERIRRATDAYGELGFRDVRGWFTRPPQTVNTRAALAAEGYLYDSGSVSDDVPYFDEVDGRPFLVVPYSLDVNDVRFIKGQLFTSDDFARYAISSFDVLLDEGRRWAPRMMSVGLHSRIIGRPGRLDGLARFIEHVAAASDVWIAGRNAIAEHWVRANPRDGLWNWPGE